MPALGPRSRHGAMANTQGRSAAEQAYPLGMTNNHRIRHVQKQAALYYCRNCEEFLLQSRRVSNQPEVTIEYIIAIIGEPRLAIGATPQRDAGTQPFHG